METAAPFSKTIAISELIAKIYGKMKKPSVIADNSCDRTGKILGETAKICRAISAFYEPTAWIGVGTVTIFEWIDESGSTIDTT